MDLNYKYDNKNITLIENVYVVSNCVVHIIINHGLHLTHSTDHYNYKANIFIFKKEEDL